MHTKYTENRVVFVQHGGIRGGKFLWTRNRGKIRAISWRETFHENQHTGEPLNWLSGLELTSCPVRYQVPHHLAGSERACVFTHTHAGRHAHRRSWVHMHLAQTFLLWREWPVWPCLVCSSALSKCDKTHEWVRRNSGDLQHRDRFTALLLQTYIHWNIYSPPVIVIYCGLGKEQICTSIFFFFIGYLQVLSEWNTLMEGVILWLLVAYCKS